MDTGPDCVCCPVCTLFLREGISLKKHLNTHPKDQVIEALVRCSESSYITKEQEKDSVGETCHTSQVVSNEQDGQSLSDCTAPSVHTSPYPTFGSSHFTATAAITYQQFMSSNACAGSTVMPQYVSVPALLTSPNSGQATVMPVLYNPYLLQYQQQQQQQQQIQFYNSTRGQTPQSPLRQILPAFQNPSVESLQQTNQFSTSSNSTIPIMNQNTQTNGSPASCTSPLSSPISGNILKSTHDPEENDNICIKNKISANKYFNNNKSSPNSPKSSVPVQCKEQRKDITSFVPVEMSKNLDKMHDSCIAVPLSDGNTNNLRVTGHEDAHYMNFLQYDKDDNYVFESQKPSNAEKQGNITLQREIYRNLNRDESTSPGLRVRTDLNNTSEEKEAVQVPRTVNCELVNNSTIKQLHSAQNTSQMVESNLEMQNLDEIMKGSLVQLPQDSLDNSEYITADCTIEEADVTENTPQPISQTIKDNCSSNANELENNKLLDLDTSGQINLIEIDGMHILVPSQFLDSTAMLGHNIAMLQAANRNTENIEEDGKTDTRDTEVPHMANLDIQTDEMMPPRGELSEQESIGGNDIWVQAFREREDDVSTSYDLLARESWTASDGSDAETTEGIVERRNMTTSAKRKGKTARAYKCWSCGESFNCPKERRVHQSKYHASSREMFECPKARAQHSAIEEESFDFPKEHSLQGSTNCVSEKSFNCLQERDPRQSMQHSSITASVLLPKAVKKEENNEEEVESKVRVKTEASPLALVFIKSDKDIGADADLVQGMSQDEKVVPVVKKHKPLFTCTQCNENFISVRCLRLHMRSTHKDLRENKHTCGICKENFPTEVMFHKHLKIHPLECNRCGKFFYRRQNLNLHIKRHLGIKPHRCSICDKAFITKQKLTEHTNSHTGNAPLKCTVCSETFRRYSNLIQHKNRYHLKLKKKVKDFICHCGEVFHSKKKLEWHKEIHDEKPKCCTFCSERFVHAASLTRHVRRAHDQRYVPKIGREGENVSCPVCSCVFLKTSLHVHMRVHSGERPFPCHICGKGFTTKWNLQLHRWTHASRSTKPFKCSLCNGAFFRRTDYTAHMHSHRNVRPYTCNYCGSQFIRKYNCIRHVKEHEADKAFTCTICKKTFHRSYYLKEHMRIHSGSRPFTCHICGKTSSTKSNHNKHVKIHHAREPVNTEG